ncbi:MAG: hypothetical protein WBD27_09050 [Pyrinomonadaceae bacterium]
MKATNVPTPPTRSFRHESLVFATPAAMNGRLINSFAAVLPLPPAKGSAA